MTSPKLQAEYDRLHPAPQPPRVVVPVQTGVNWCLIYTVAIVAIAWGFAVGVAVMYGVFQ